MLINEMTEQECREVLAQATSGNLGCSLNDQPYVVPIGLAYEPEYIYVFSTFGKKIKWMRVNPKVCVQVQQVANQSEWSSVIANGTYQELPAPQFERERAHARSLLQKHHDWWLNALGERRVNTEDGSIEPLFFRIRVESMTGLRATDGAHNSRKT